jgi:hypothetical protein
MSAERECPRNEKGPGPGGLGPGPISAGRFHRPLGGGANAISVQGTIALPPALGCRRLAQRGLPDVVSVVTIPVRIDSEHAIQAADDGEALVKVPFGAQIG